MIRIAHLSDLHLNGTSERRARFLSALARAKTLGARHLVLTGDLTALGRKKEFHELKDALGAWPYGRTVIPGNHDGFGHYDHSFGLGAPLDLEEGTIVPIDTRYPKRSVAFLALGFVGPDQFECLRDRVRIARKPVVIAMHHGPQRSPFETFMGLVDRKKMLGLLREFPHAHVVCGHDHRVMDLGRIHVAASVAHHADPLRIYELGAGRFEPSYRSQIPGKFMTLGRLPMDNERC